MKSFTLIAIACLSLLTACSAVKKKSGTPTDGPPPKLLAPSVKKVWVPPSLKDGGQVWEEGHYIYKIERGTSWSR